MRPRVSLEPRIATVSDPAPEVSRATERHFSVSELAAAWNLSADTIRKLFEKEPGVLIIGSEAGKYSRRRYITLRVPESVALRVHRRLSRV
jgi:hypothetical protein